MEASARVVITGFGAVTPLAADWPGTWKALCAGQSGIGSITQFDATEFPCRFAGECRDFQVSKFIDDKEARRNDRFIHFALAGAAMAIADAGLEVTDANRDRIGVFVGAGLGGIRTLEDTHTVLMERGPKRISPFFIPALIANLAPGQISLRHGLRGPNLAHVSACSTGAHSIGEAMHCIRRGDADVMVAGGVEATISPLGIGGFTAMRALSTRNGAPTKASRPFDKDRDGFVAAEGAGIMVLESLAHAKARGARIRAELVGYGLSADAHHITSPSEGGEGAARCMRMALKSAAWCVNPEDVGYVNAHGTSTPQGDIAETQALKAVFGEHARRLAVSSTKSMTGHMLGAAGGLEAIAAAAAVAEGVLPPTINYETPDPECDLDYVPNQARETRTAVALSNSFGFGGTNATLIFRRFAG